MRVEAAWNCGAILRRYYGNVKEKLKSSISSWRFVLKRKCKVGDFCMISRRSLKGSTLGVDRMEPSFQVSGVQELLCASCCKLYVRLSHGRCDVPERYFYRRPSVII